jgi:FkbM family methyltransferase
MNKDLFTITQIEIKENPSMAMVHFRTNTSKYENKNLLVKICDGCFDYTYHHAQARLNKDCAYFIGTTIPERLSNSIRLQIFDDKDLIFSETFASSNIKYSNLFKEAPEILKYINDGVDISTFIEVFLLNEYDCDLFSLKENDVVLDIGSNVGAFITKAIKNKCSKIYSCEPFMNSFSILEKYFGHLPQVILNNAAISEKTEEKSLVLLSDSETSGGNFIADNESIDWHDRNKPQQKIQGYSFLDFIKKNNIELVDYFKCDCEGGEHYIFTDKNAYYIRNNIKNIAIEYHGRYENLTSFFEKNNFKYQLITKGNKLGMIYAKNNFIK